MNTHNFTIRSPKQERKRRNRRRIKLAVFLAVPVFFAWALFYPHVAKTSGPVSLEQAEDCPIPLPKGAKNIRFYSRMQFNFFVEFVRFEAPVTVCRQHIGPALSAWGETFDYLRDEAEPVRELDEPPRPQRYPEEYGVTWFDPHTIRKGVTAGGGGSGIPMIWVDTERGIFYYMLTD